MKNYLNRFKYFEKFYKILNHRKYINIGSRNSSTVLWPSPPKQKSGLIEFKCLHHGYYFDIPYRSSRKTIIWISNFKSLVYMQNQVYKSIFSRLITKFKEFPTMYDFNIRKYTQVGCARLRTHTHTHTDRHIHTF